MKEARLFAAGDLRVVQAERPSPNPSESLVRVEAVGLCGSDLHWFVDGGMGQSRLVSPLVLGHEIAGTVCSGDLDGVRVAVDPAIPCEACARCFAGERNLCPAAGFAGHEAHDGGLREYVKWPTHLLHPLPATISTESGALLEPLGVALHAYDRAALPLGGTVSVIGCGPIGLLLIKLAALAGSQTILAVEPLAHRRAAAERLGADVVLDTRADLAAALAAAGTPDGTDAAFEAAGNDSAVEAAVRLARPGGHVLLVGIPSHDTVTFTASTARRKGLTLSMVRRMNDVIPRAMHFAATGQVDLDSLVTERFSLERSAEAFRAADARTGLKVLIRP